jgi:hypothetical protein
LSKKEVVVKNSIAWIIWNDLGYNQGRVIGVFDDEDEAIKGVGRAHLGGQTERMEVIGVHKGSILSDFPPKKHTAVDEVSK